MGCLKLAYRTDYTALKVVQGGLYGSEKGSGGKYRYGFNGKEKDDDIKNIEGSSYDFGARMYDSRLGRFLSIDPDADNFAYQSTYLYGSNSPILYVDVDGRYSVRNHYDMTYDAAIKLGFSHEVADKMAYFASTYADHPEPKVLNAFGVVNIGDDISYGRYGVYYYSVNSISRVTRFSQNDDPEHSAWHSMMTTKEAQNGMCKEYAKERGLNFAWNAILQGAKNDDLALQMQGIHALKDADAHEGCSTEEHLGFNTSPTLATYMVLHDMVVNNTYAKRYTKSALMIVGLLGNDQKVIDNIVSQNSYNDKLFIPMYGMSEKNINKVKQALIDKGYSNFVINSDEYRTEVNSDCEEVK